ncbi:MAG: pyruvate kinase [Candidatus Hydrogenedentota bacterium]
MHRRTKIVCTIGPASESEAVIAALLDAGMNVARLNFSHGDRETHQRHYERLRRIAAARGVNLAVMVDLQGPKIRTGPMRGGADVALEQDAVITITTAAAVGDAARISTTYANLPYDVHAGDRILIADGMIELRVETVAPPEVHCRVVRPGVLGQFKGINLPGVQIAEPSLTQKDRADLAFGLALGADYVALSFVRSAADVRMLAQAMAGQGRRAGIVAKIERPEALDELAEIAHLSDAVMVARGDLGVEIDFAEVPQVQKRLIRVCNEAGTPVITATQMLESMVQHARPTRAEVADVANAIYDGTDAVMLSAETAAGAYPVEACQVMARIARRIDAAGPAYSAPGMQDNASFEEGIGEAVCRMVPRQNLRRVVCFTYSGHTAHALARHRPGAPIIALTTAETTQRLLALVWGVEAFLLHDDLDNFDTLLETSETLLHARNLVQRGDVIAVVAGIPLAQPGCTNILKLHRINGSN